MYSLHSGGVKVQQGCLPTTSMKGFCNLTTSTSQVSCCRGHLCNRMPPPVGRRLLAQEGKRTFKGHLLNIITSGMLKACSSDLFVALCGRNLINCAAALAMHLEVRDTQVVWNTERPSANRIPIMINLDVNSLVL